MRVALVAGIPQSALPGLSGGNRRPRRFFLNHVLFVLRSGIVIGQYRTRAQKQEHCRDDQD
jgi:hypothetical protein